MRVMRTSNKTQWQREVGRVFARALLIVFLWVPERVTGNCGGSTAFNLSAFSPETVTLVSHSWIDTGGSIRMATPVRTNTTYQSNSSVTGVENAMGMGQALYKTPVSVVDPRTNNSLSFSTFFSFSLISEMQVPITSNGMAFLIMPEQSSILGTPIGGPPLFDPYNAVWWNSPSHTFAVQLEKWDHLIQLNSTRVNQTNVINVQPSAANTYSTYLEDAATNFAWIDYDATRLHLQVSISNTSDGPKWTLLSTTCDLSGVFLNPMYIGFYSRDKVSVNSWSFSSAGCPALLPASNISLPPFHPPPDLGSGNVTDTNKFPATKNSWISRNRQLLICVGAGTGCALLICLLAAVFLRCLCFVAKYRGAKSVPNQDIPFTPQIFMYRTLSMATNGFDERALLGRGGFGSVYKGIIAEDESSTLVAVKRIESKNDAQRERQFIAEVSSIGRLRHRNLVQLLGWCHEKGELLLVYDYMPNGSLDRLLFGTQEKVLPWESRYNIVSGVAEALAYLHGEWEKQVVHRDVKASNVLLDSNFNPRLGDFGLARLVDHDKNPKSTSIAVGSQEEPPSPDGLPYTFISMKMGDLVGTCTCLLDRSFHPSCGTLGYLAPEITITGKATDKTDVFSFGALALEVACGRRPIERTLPPQEVVLVDWVWELHSKGELMNAIDSRLPRGRLPPAKVTTLLNVGLLCSHPDPTARPSMRHVVRILTGEVSSPTVPDSKPIPPFTAYRRAPSHHYNTPTTRAMVASTKPSSNKILSKTQSRVSNCSSIP